MLDTYELRKNLTETRKELAHALYQYDAACRVISRMAKEKQQSNQMLKLVQEDLNASKIQIEVL